MGAAAATSLGATCSGVERAEVNAVSTMAPSVSAVFPPHCNPALRNQQAPPSSCSTAPQTVLMMPSPTGSIINPPSCRKQRSTAWLRNSRS